MSFSGRYTAKWVKRQRRLNLTRSVVQTIGWLIAALGWVISMFDGSFRLGITTVLLGLSLCILTKRG